MIEPTDAFDGTQVPMVLGSLRGLRTWDIDEVGVLTPRFRHTPWNEGDNTAVCLIDPWHPRGFGRGGQHKAGTKSCSCGFYAYYAERDVAHLSTDSVFGVIEAWGRVSFGHRGFRAEKAKIVALYNPYLHAHRIPTAGGDTSPKVKWFKRVFRRLYFYSKNPIRIFPEIALLVGGFLSVIIGGIVMDIGLLSNIGQSLIWGALFSQISLTIVRYIGNRVYPSPRPIPFPPTNMKALGTWHRTGRLPYNTMQAVQSSSVPPRYLEEMAKEYSKIPVYNSISEMLEDFPPTKYEDIKHLGDDDD